MAGGLVLLALCLVTARVLARGTTPAYLHATVVFAALWTAMAAFNMWVGVTRAGYGFMEELPIFFLIALVPVVLGFFLQYRLLRS
jgi:hypothetical protein